MKTTGLYNCRIGLYTTKKRAAALSVCPFVCLSVCTLRHSRRLSENEGISSYYNHAWVDVRAAINRCAQPRYGIATPTS